jgi:hypothetical protein
MRDETKTELMCCLRSRSQPVCPVFFFSLLVYSSVNQMLIMIPMISRMLMCRLASVTAVLAASPSAVMAHMLKPASIISLGVTHHMNFNVGLHPLMPVYAASDRTWHVHSRLTNSAIGLDQIEFPLLMSASETWPALSGRPPVYLVGYRLCGTSTIVCW